MTDFDPVAEREKIRAEEAAKLADQWKRTDAEQNARIQKMIADAVGQALVGRGIIPAAQPPTKESTGDIKCLHCGKVVKKGDTSPDHINGCEGHTGFHVYRQIFED